MPTLRPRFSLGWVILLALVDGVLIGLLTATAALAVWTDVFNNTDNAFTIDTLDPPSGLAASVVGSNIRLDWTPTVDTYASGYKVLRGTTSGGPYTEIGTATPYTTTTYTDNTAAAGTRYYYVLETYFQSWLSVYSNEANAAVSANTGWRSPTAEAAVTSNSGDNNGFESNPTNAFADGGGYAEDVDSGTNTNTACNNTGKDRHVFYNYAFAIPAGSAVDGIEVRLDAWIDAGTAGTRVMCVQLSWDGGTTWTAAKTTPTLSTSEATYILGTTADAWGRIWGSNEFSDANFRLRITNVAPNNARDFFLDWVPVQVTYTPP
jgi:hypothetical protein